MTKLNDLSKEQLLMYAGAVGSAATGLACLGKSPVLESHVYTKTIPTVPGGMGRRLLNLHALETTGLAMVQALSAHEKPSTKMVGLCGAGWLGAGVISGVHTFHNKSIKQEVGTALTIGQVVLGGAMIARALQMNKNKIV